MFSDCDSDYDRDEITFTLFLSLKKVATKGKTTRTSESFV